MHPKSIQICRRCKRELPRDAFDPVYSNGRYKGLRKSCRPCREEYQLSRDRPKTDSCPDCGGPMTRGSKRCAACHHAEARSLTPPNPSGMCMCGCGQTTSIAAQSSTAVGNVKGEHVRFIVGHGGTKNPLDAANYIVNPVTGCWEWAKSKTDAGYGTVSHQGRQTLAHRVFYTLLVGDIPDGTEIDHLCRNRCCVNPEHLEAVPRRVNLRRGAGTILNPDSVREIRRLWATGAYTRREIGERFGIASTTVQMVVYRHSWKDVD